MSECIEQCDSPDDHPEGQKGCATELRTIEDPNLDTALSVRTFYPLGGKPVVQLLLAKPTKDGGGVEQIVVDFTPDFLLQAFDSFYDDVLGEAGFADELKQGQRQD